MTTIVRITYTIGGRICLIHDNSENYDKENDIDANWKQQGAYTSIETKEFKQLYACIKYSIRKFWTWRLVYKLVSDVLKCNLNML